MKNLFFAACLGATIGLAGCQTSTSTGPVAVIPVPASVQSGVQIAFNAICGAGGLKDTAEAISNAGANISTYVSEATTICALGVPDSPIIAGLDIFLLYQDFSAVLAKRGAVPVAKADEAKALHTKFAPDVKRFRAAKHV